MKKILDHIEDYIGAVVFVAMLLLTFANVVMRNFSASISFTEEITTSLFVLLCMLGTAIAAREQSHLGLGVITEMLPAKVRKCLAAIANVLGVVFSIILLVTGIGMVQTEIEMKQISIALGIPQWIYGSFFPIGAAFMIWRFSQAALQNFKEFKEVK